MSLHEVKINKKKLLLKVKENRDKHHAEFLEAVKGYHTAMAQYLENEIELLESCLEENNILKAGKAPKPPVHYLNAYDSAISILEWNEEDEVILDRREFSNLIKDDWQWKSEFSAFVKEYNSSSGVDLNSTFAESKIRMNKVKSCMYEMGDVTPTPMKLQD